MERICKEQRILPVTTVLFDFDGTISTLRCGWEDIMEPLMTELIEKDGGRDEDVRGLVREYINESTGIQTIFQMKWLAEQVRIRNPAADCDPWDYKEEYNRRLLTLVLERLRRLEEGSAKPEDFMISGSRGILEMLSERKVALYVASGTDDADVKREVEALGLSVFFTGITGAPEGRECCSKEAVIRDLIERKGVEGNRLAVVGDGKVEIAIGRENGARTLGIAADERALAGVDPVKYERLRKAGADVIIEDFRDRAALEKFFFGG